MCSLVRGSMISTHSTRLSDVDILLDSFDSSLLRRTHSLYLCPARTQHCPNCVRVCIFLLAHSHAHTDSLMQNFLPVFFRIFLLSSFLPLPCSTTFSSKKTLNAQNPFHKLCATFSPLARKPEMHAREKVSHARTRTRAIKTQNDRRRRGTGERKNRQTKMRALTHTTRPYALLVGTEMKKNFVFCCHCSSHSVLRAGRVRQKVG